MLYAFAKKVTQYIHDISAALGITDKGTKEEEMILSHYRCRLHRRATHVTIFRKFIMVLRMNKHCWLYL